MATIKLIYEGEESEMIVVEDTVKRKVSATIKRLTRILKELLK
jgi:hypothetical protein